MEKGWATCFIYQSCMDIQYLDRVSHGGFYCMTYTFCLKKQATKHQKQGNKK